jgi:hypothetical protein
MSFSTLVLTRTDSYSYSYPYECEDTRTLPLSLRGSTSLPYEYRRGKKALLVLDGPSPLGVAP